MVLGALLSLSIIEQVQLWIVLGLLFIEHIIRTVIFCVWGFFPRPLLNWLYSKVYILRSLFAFELDAEKQYNEAKAYDRRDETINSKILINRMKYRCDDYFSKTNDGFILCLHRVVKDEVDTKRYPILIVHGLMMSDEAFIYSEDVSIVKSLVESGFDVWLGNCRGNKYSWRHDIYKRDSPEYWNFSIDEYGRYDIPALIRCVLAISEYDKLIYVGFSNGAGSLIAAVQHNILIKKQISHFIGLAPACKVRAMNKDAQSFGVLYPMFFSPNSDIFFSCFGKKAMIPSADQWKRILKPRLYTYILDLCMLTLFGWTFDKDLVPYERRSTFYFHLYSTASVKIVHHWFQVIGSQRFDRYKSRVAFLGDIDRPSYNVGLISSMPFTAFVGEDDRLSDIDWMKENLGGTMHVIPRYKHLEFLCSSDVRELVHEKLIEICKDVSAKKLNVSDSEPQNIDNIGCLPILSTPDGVVPIANLFE